MAEETKACPEEETEKKTGPEEKAENPKTEEKEDKKKKREKAEKVPKADYDRLQAEFESHKQQYLRVLAEYDNFRKRSQKEKESIYADAKADALTAFLPVYDNLERALKQETADEAYKKGVEMTMTQLKEVLAKLGIEEIPALGEPFDPNLHNAVMHVEDEGAGENTIVDVFQTGFKSGDKVVRFAMVKVAN
mgnify:CR=1 FL=1